MTKREKFKTRTIILAGDSQRDLAIAMIRNAPIGIEIVAREKVKSRKMDQNAIYWAGTLADIANQAWVQGRQYSAEVWHEYVKTLYLPNKFDPELCEEGYKKYDITPSGDRVMIGSTTQLTVKGFSQYLEQVYAFGAELGVLFGASRNG